MVGPGEVDNDLQPETAEECRKYGNVVKCMVYECPPGSVPPDEAVRIFVQFSGQVEAMKGNEWLCDVRKVYYSSRGLL